MIVESRVDKPIRKYDVKRSKNKRNMFFRGNMKKEWLTIVFQERKTRVMSGERPKNTLKILTPNLENVN